ncbi:hypothetical protein ACFFIY_10340 [Bhargavaea ullalensis]|uniref:Intracellular proteinase inhibitor n=1 Tax=Bhargavaea ullalensis TaxID=1265685 RepID=A0ABV2G9C4_9BACL
MKQLRWAAAASIALLLAGCGAGNNENGDKADDAVTEDSGEVTGAETDPGTEQAPDKETDDQEAAAEEDGEEDGEVSEDEESGGQQENIESGSEFTASGLFPPEGAQMHFKGEGNEFAELDIRVLLSDGKHVVFDEDNGGVTMRKAYRIGDDRIEQVMAMPLEGTEPVPTAEELGAMDPMNTYLVFPAQEGAEFEGWKVVSTDESVETPFKTFEHAVLIEEETADFTNRTWLVPGFGEVKRESVMEEEGQEPFVVTSVLESVSGM